MNFTRYYWLVLRTAWKHAFGYADLISSSVGAMLAVIIHFSPKWKQLLTGVLWQIPIWILATVAIVRLISAPFWLWKIDRGEIKNQQKQIDDLVAETEPSLRLFFDETQPYYTVQLGPDGPPKLIMSVSVENVGNKHLERCQVRVKYNQSGHMQSRMGQNFERYYSCAPFSLVPDDSKLIDIFSMIDPHYAKDDNYISIYSFVEENGEWQESGGIPILVPASYEVTIEVLSANTRRASIRLIITHTGEDWKILNATNT
ncbi:MAG: hypothetical protein ACYCXP_10380 [Leptospirillum sp.]